MRPSILFRSAEDRERMRRASVSFLAEVPGTVRERYVDTRWGHAGVGDRTGGRGAARRVAWGDGIGVHVLPELGPLLITAGFTTATWGNETEDAVRSFQAKHKLDVDGIVVPRTLTKLSGMEG